MENPKIRFKGFTKDWEQRKLSDVLDIVTKRNGEKYGKEEVLSVSDEYGCINQIKFQGRSFAGEDISNYKIVDTGDIIYTRSPLKSKPYGIIKVVGDEIGIVSPLYIVNKVKEGNNSQFIYRVFDSPEKTNKYLSPLVRKGAKNTMNISNDEWLSGKIDVAPSYEEQYQIGLYFDHLDHFITLHQRKCDETKRLKKYMLQKMFPQNGEKVPEIRFSGFTDDWEQRKVCNITTSYSGGTPKSGYTEYYDGDIPFIRSGEIYSDKTELFITELGMKNSSAKMVHEGDILYALYGATSGEVSRAKLDGAINQAILAIVPNDDINANFLVEWFRKEKDKITDTYLQGGQGNLSAQIIKELEVTIPSYDEQNKIGLYFEQLNTLITLHQRELENLQNIKKFMLEKMFV